MPPSLISYYALRLGLGLLGMALPVILVVWGFAICECIEIQDSISDYYSLRTRDALVGTLLAIGVFLGTYRGYRRQPQDNKFLIPDRWAGILACISAVGVAFFPNSGGDVDQAVHFASAFCLFVALSYFSFLFTKTRPGATPTPMKRIRNRIYVTCGIIIAGCIVLIGVNNWFLNDTSLSDIKPVFWLESLALWAFGVAWLVKGAKAIPRFRDTQALTPPAAG